MSTTDDGTNNVPGDLVKTVRERLATMTDQERLDMFYEITDGYCKHCGRDDSEWIRGCQCWNDD